MLIFSKEIAVADIETKGRNCFGDSKYGNFEIQYQFEG